MKKNYICPCREFGHKHVAKWDINNESWLIFKGLNVNIFNWCIVLRNDSYVFKQTLTFLSGPVDACSELKSIMKSSERSQNSRQLDINNNMLSKSKNSPQLDLKQGNQNVTVT